MRSDSRTIDTGNHQFRDPSRIAAMMMMVALTFASVGCTRPSDLPVEHDAPCVPSDLLVGEWIGELTSTSGAASRRVQATYRPADERTYLATYRTTVGLGLPLQFNTTHHVTENGGVLRINEWREADVPGLGACRCRAVCTDLQLVIHYRSADDSGIMRLQRKPSDNSGPTPVHDMAGYVAAEWENVVQIAAR